MDLIKVLKDLGIKKKILATMLGRSTQTIRNWEKGGRIPKDAHVRLTKIISQLSKID